MVLKMAVLQVKPGSAAAFQAAFAEAAPILASMDGDPRRRVAPLRRGPRPIPAAGRMQTLEAHTRGFRGSPGYQRWKALLHHFYDPFPEVWHYASTSSR